MRQTRKRDPRSAAPRAIAIGNHRTSARLEEVMWNALADIANKQGKTVPDLIAEIHRTHNKASLSSAIRVYIVEYYRTALQNAQARAEPLDTQTAKRI